jgi:hypothetical protein
MVEVLMQCVTSEKTWGNGISKTAPAPERSECPKKRRFYRKTIRLTPSGPHLTHQKSAGQGE